MLARLGRRAPIAVRLALRDLARYRARSGSALGRDQPRRADRRASSAVAAAARYGNVLDYAGPNLASNQLIVYTPNGPYGQAARAAAPACRVTGASCGRMAASARGIAAALGSHDVVELDSTSATLQHAASGRNWSGPVYVATPQLLRAFGIKASADRPARPTSSPCGPGWPASSKMQLVYGHYYTSGDGGPVPQRARNLPLPEERLPGQPGDPGGRARCRPAPRRPTR